MWMAQMSSNCDKFTCFDMHLKCGATSAFCVDNVKRCYGGIDCTDKSDEANCDNVSWGPNDFQCNSGRCIPRARCPNGEDAPASCFTSKANAKYIPI